MPNPSPSAPSERDTRLVSLTVGQIRHLLELLALGHQLPRGRNRRATLEAKLRAALLARPTPEFPEEVE